MHHKLFRLKDLLIMVFPIMIMAGIIGAIIWNLVSPDGEPIPAPGWIVSGATCSACIGIVIAFYWKRWWWVRKYAYTVGGVEYFYEPGTIKYDTIAIQQNTDVMLDKWFTFYEECANRHLIPVQYFLRGSICIFRPESHWEHTALGWWTRKVTGIAGCNWAVVGQGKRPIEKTAHAHELAHIHLNRWETVQVDEDEAHAIFKEAGID